MTTIGVKHPEVKRAVRRWSVKGLLDAGWHPEVILALAMFRAIVGRPTGPRRRLRRSA